MKASTKRPRQAAAAAQAPSGVTRVQPSSQTAPHVEQHVASQPSAKPANTITREVYQLTGEQTPATLVPTVPLSSQRAKPRVRTAWEMAPFANPARSDGLKLHHWKRVGASDDYPFVRFNRDARIVTYSDDEYSAVELSLPSAPGVRMQQVGSRASPPPPLLPPPPAPFVSANVAVAGRPDAQVADGARRPSTPPLQTTRASLSAQRSSPTLSSSSVATTIVQAPLDGILRQGVHMVPPQKMWTKAETDHLFSLCKQFDLRFPVIHDRWPDSYAVRSLDELKDRYYTFSRLVIDYRSKGAPDAMASQPVALQKHCQAIVMNPFDYEYECIRKNQLQWQYMRSKAELREEEETVREARRIEANRKRLAKERQRLAKLLTPAGEVGPVKGADHAAVAAGTVTPQKTFPHRKVSAGPYARSSLVYAPVSQSVKVCKRVDAALQELKVNLRPMPTCTVVDNFDLLRMDVLNFLELQRTVAKKEEEGYSLSVKLAKAKGEPIPPPPPGVPLSHKKRRADDVETGSIFGGALELRDPKNKSA